MCILCAERTIFSLYYAGAVTFCMLINVWSDARKLSPVFQFALSVCIYSVTCWHIGLCFNALNAYSDNTATLFKNTFISFNEVVPYEYKFALWVLCVCIFLSSPRCLCFSLWIWSFFYIFLLLLPGLYIVWNGYLRARQNERDDAKCLYFVSHYAYTHTFAYGNVI